MSYVQERKGTISSLAKYSSTAFCLVIFCNPLSKNPIWSACSVVKAANDFCSPKPNLLLLAVTADTPLRTLLAGSAYQDNAKSTTPVKKSYASVCGLAINSNGLNKYLPGVTVGVIPLSNNACALSPVNCTLLADSSKYSSNTGAPNCSKAKALAISGLTPSSISC